MENVGRLSYKHIFYLFLGYWVDALRVIACQGCISPIPLVFLRLIACQGYIGWMYLGLLRAGDTHHPHLCFFRVTIALK